MQARVDALVQRQNERKTALTAAMAWFNGGSRQRISTARVYVAERQRP